MGIAGVQVGRTEMKPGPKEPHKGDLARENGARGPGINILGNNAKKCVIVSLFIHIASRAEAQKLVWACLGLGIEHMHGATMDACGSLDSM